MESVSQPQTLQAVQELNFDQPTELKNLLQELLTRDTYNKFCIDCNRNESSHVCITYGTFICEECAKLHISVLGMDKSYVKPIFGDLWDSYQLRVVQMGGNKRLWDFFKLYNGLEQRAIGAKYNTSAAQYYRRKISHEATYQQFNDKEPPKNAEEYLDRGVDQAKKVAVQAGQGLAKVGGQIGEKFTELGIKDKFKGLFAKKDAGNTA